ncbi:MAG: aldo/keto reductase [Fibrobacteres bacterium]|nr:aldo/keto reductase [Fibrobacterota bacterium]
MKYNLLGNTGLKVSELCLGTMTFGGQGMWKNIGALQQQEADALLRRGIEAGINFIDTANVYSEGLAEEITGKAIRNLGLKREDLVIATKVRGKTDNTPNGAGLSRKHILHQVDASLKRLNMDFIDLYQIHGYDELTPLEDTLDTLDGLVTSGKVRYIGCSNLAAWHVMKAAAYSKYTRQAKFVSLQAYYTLAGRDLEREVVPVLKDQNMGLMVWSPLAGGFLSGKYTRGNDGVPGSRRTAFDFPPIDKERAYNVIDVLQALAQEKQSTVARLALAWLLHQPVVTSVILGVKKPDQLEDNLKAVEVKFTGAELKRLDEVSKFPPEYPGWMLAHQREGG